MIFLMQYDRSAGSIVRLTTYADSEREKAQDDRLALELDLNRKGVTHEVVLFDAANEAALRLTHRRYFESLQEISASFGPNHSGK